MTTDEFPDDADSPADPAGNGPGPSADGLIVNERDTQEGLLVAVCDCDVLGETFEEGAVSLTVTEEFYGGEDRSDEEALDSLSRAAVANIVGSRAVRLAIDAGYVEEDNVMAVDGTHHAQFMRL